MPTPGEPDISLEREYRRAYVDGYAAALAALAALAEEGDEPEDITAALREHWEEELHAWQAADPARRMEPPELV